MSLNKVELLQLLVGVIAHAFPLPLHNYAPIYSKNDFLMMWILFPLVTTLNGRVPFLACCLKSCGATCRIFAASTVGMYMSFIRGPPSSKNEDFYVKKLSPDDIRYCEPTYFC